MPAKVITPVVVSQYSRYEQPARTTHLECRLSGIVEPTICEDADRYTCPASWLPRFFFKGAITTLPPLKSVIPETQTLTPFLQHPFEVDRRGSEEIPFLFRPRWLLPFVIPFERATGHKLWTVQASKSSRKWESGPGRESQAKFAFLLQTETQTRLWPFFFIPVKGKPI